MADRTCADVPVIKNQHEFSHVLPFYRISVINAVPEFVDQLQLFRFLAVAEIA